jgi:septum formation protein
MFISHLEGSFSGVMGLPLYETSQLLKRQGLVIA